jgi:hypothetical protein
MADAGANAGGNAGGDPGADAASEPASGASGSAAPSPDKPYPADASDPATLHGEPPELDMIEDGPDDLTDPAGRSGDGESGRSPESPSDTRATSDPSSTS